MNIFVTGGAGYVGSHCVRALCDAGHVVTVYDNLTSGGHKEAVDKRATLVVGDLGDSPRVARALSEGRFEAVMHFAALLDVNEEAAAGQALKRLEEPAGDQASGTASACT